MSTPIGRRRKVFISIFLIVVLLGGGTVIARLLYAMREEPARRDTSRPAPMVRVVRLERETVTEQFVGYGTVSPSKVSRIAAELSGTVVELVGGHREGVAVAEGDLLVRLDDRDYVQALEQAQALVAADRAAINELKLESEKLGELIEIVEREVQLSKAEFDRVSGLFNRNQAAKKEFDFANIALQRVNRVRQEYEMQLTRIGPQSRQLSHAIAAKEAAEQQARIALDRTRIRAPYAGRIEQRFIEEGDFVTPGVTLLTLVNTETVEIAARLPAAVHDRVEAGARCQISYESLPDVTWSGTVTRKAPTIDKSSRTFNVYIEVDNAELDRPCVPGMFVTVTIDGPRHDSVLLVPRGAVANSALFVVEDGKAQARSVSVRRIIRERTLVEGDVEEGDLVICSRPASLENGGPVRYVRE